jgi:hypothetical protein
MIKQFAAGNGAQGEPVTTARVDAGLQRLDGLPFMQQPAAKRDVSSSWREPVKYTNGKKLLAALLREDLALRVQAAGRKA